MDDERQQLPEQKPEGDDQKFSKIFHSIPGAGEGAYMSSKCQEAGQGILPRRLLYSSKDLKFQHKILMYIHRTSSLQLLFTRGSAAVRPMFEQ